MPERRPSMLLRLVIVLSVAGSSAVAAPGDIGTAAPYGGAMSAPNGRWFVVCQARADTDGDGKLETTFSHHSEGGDKMLPYLVLGTGPGTLIEYPAARSKNGEWLAVVTTNNKLELIDGVTYKRTVIDAELVNDLEWTEEKNSRFVSIAANGTRMTYLKGDTITIRDLPSGTERRVTVNGTLWRADVDAEGTWAEVQVVRADTDRNGKIEYPGRGASAMSRSGVDTLHMRAPEPTDTVTTLRLDLAKGRFVEDTTIIMPLGDKLLRRRSDGALMLDNVELVDAKCNAVLYSTITTPAPRVAFSCGTRGRDMVESRVEIAGPGLVRTKTRAKTHRTWGNDNTYGGRFAMITDAKGKTTHFVDLADGRETLVPGEWKHSYGNVAVIQAKTGAWLLLDLAKRTTTKLGVTGALGDGILGTVTIGASVFDMHTGKRLGASTDRIVFVDLSGRALVQAGAPSTPGVFGYGPLRWKP